MFESTSLGRTLWQSCTPQPVKTGPGDIELTARPGLTAGFVRGAFGSEAELTGAIAAGGFSGDRIGGMVDPAFTHYFSTLDAALAVVKQTDFTSPEHDAEAAHRIAGIAVQNIAVQIHRQTYDEVGSTGLSATLGNAALDVRHALAASGLNETTALKRQALSELVRTLAHSPARARPAVQVQAEAHLAVVDAVTTAVDARLLTDRRALQNTLADEVKNLKRTTEQFVALKLENAKHFHNANAQGLEERIIARIVAQTTTSKAELDTLRAAVRSQTESAENLRNHSLAAVRDVRSAVQSLRSDVDHLSHAACPEARTLRTRIEELAAEAVATRLLLKSVGATIAKADRANDMAAKITDRLTAAFSALKDKSDMQHLADFHDIESLKSAVRALQSERTAGAHSAPAGNA